MLKPTPHRACDVCDAGPSTYRPAAIALAALLATLSSGAQAFEFDTGSTDLSVRWDNTFRYNYGNRVESRDSLIGNSAVSDEGDYSFNRGQTVTNRIDVLTELDVVWRKRFGARVSAAGWADSAYGSASRTNPSAPLSQIPSYVGKQYSDYVQRYYHGPSGELLDAFVFGGADLGDVPVNVKLGRHALYWGESLFLGGNMNGIAYAQSPLDLQKGFATPGVEAKELFRPLNQLSAQAQLTPELSLAGAYMLEWDSARYPEGGTYLGPVDFAFNGPDRQYISSALGFAQRGAPSEPKQHGEGGLATRWSPEWLDGTMGFYWRNFADKLPQTLLTRVGPGISRYNLIYADNVDLYGVSLAKNIGGISFGTELSYRYNTPLNSTVLGIAPGLPGAGETKGPRGDTVHGLINAVGVIPKTALFDAATWAAELTWAEWTKVRSGANLFYAEGYAACAGKTKWDGCTTKDFVGSAFSFTPTWYQVWPGVDLSMPVTYAIGLYGNAPTVFGGNQKNGNYSVGLGVDVRQKYRFDLKYIDYVGVTNSTNGTAVTSQNGFTSLLTDRGFVSLTFKTTF